MENAPKRPLTALLIAPDYLMRDNIMYGSKAITIREGIRDYKPGEPVMLCCHLVPWCVQATIESVEHMQVKDVPDEACRDDGFENNAAMLAGMKRFYPNLTGESAVTVIRWKDVKGALVDKYAADMLQRGLG